MENVKTKRPAGRPEGALSRVSREAREKAAATGMLPHEILLAVARGQILYYEETDAKGNVLRKPEARPDLDKRIDAAKAAAPYYAPKISTVEVITGVADDDLDAIIARLATEAGIDLGSEGESPAEASSPQQAGRSRVKLNV